MSAPGPVNLLVDAKLVFFLLLAVDIGYECCELYQPLLCVLEHGLATVKGDDLCHLLIGQSEVEEIEVLRNVGWGLRAGDHDVSLLDVPTQDDLGRELAVLPPAAGGVAATLSLVL